MTSHDVVQHVRRIYGERSIGHLGTLDPFATGLLVLLLGRATRLATFIDAEPKVYDATISISLAVPTEAMTAVTTPTLIMYGAGTWPKLRDAAHELAKLMPAARLLEVDAANHDIPTEETASLIRAHLG